MSVARVSIRRWQGLAPPEEALPMALLEEDGLEAFPWSNVLEDSYVPHIHGYAKVICVVEGSIDFDLANGRVELHGGDRLDLPAGIEHPAVGGREGVSRLRGNR